MKTSLRMMVAAAAATVAVAIPATANAGTYNDSASGSETATQTTTLNYARPHASFNVRIQITRSGLPQFGVSTKYSINMYDAYGRQVWSAGGQGDRTYYIGGNVTKIVVTPDTKWYTLTTRWQRV